MSAVTSYARGDISGVFSSVTGLIKTASGSGQKADIISKATKTSPADCVRENLVCSHRAHLRCRFRGVVARIHRPARTHKKLEKPQAL
jgi:hypothetical protein